MVGGPLWPCDPEMTCLTADTCQAESLRPRSLLPDPWAHSHFHPCAPRELSAAPRVTLTRTCQHLSASWPVCSESWMHCCSSEIARGLRRD